MPQRELKNRGSEPLSAESANRLQTAEFAACWSRLLRKPSPTRLDWRSRSIVQPAHPGKLDKALFIVARYLLS